MRTLQSLATTAYSALGGVVSPGYYSLHTGKEGLPRQLTNFALPVAEKFYGVLAAASYSSQNPPTISGITLKPGQPVYAVNIIRHDPGHLGLTDPHANVDKSFSFLGADGKAYRLSFDEHPNHCRRLSKDAGLEAVLQNFGIPHKQSGRLSDLSTGAGWQNFSTAFPSRRRRK